MKENNLPEIFTDQLLQLNTEDIIAVVSFGGLHRENKIIKDWSDIDIIIVWKKIKSEYSELLSLVVSKFEEQNRIRLDVRQITEGELLNNRHLYNESIINALKRSGQHTVLFGKIPSIDIPLQQEKMSNLFDINETMFFIRKYCLQIYSDKKQIKKYFPTVIRKTYKIVRASLGLFEVFCNPYEESLVEIRKIVPDFDFNILETLINIRISFSQISSDDLFPVLRDIEKFLEDFVPLILELYDKKQSAFII
jgi:hypothetical protein